MVRFDMRNNDPSANTRRYGAALDMAEWADEHGCSSILLSEHHPSADGYLPSPVPMAAAIAARTRRAHIHVGALLLNFYDPIKLAEDMIVVDHLSGGRVSYVIGLGYRPEEHLMFGVGMDERGAVMDRKLDALRGALRGERFAYEGREVQVTPAPRSPGGPTLAYGGHSVAAARRAGRLGMDLFAEGGDEPLAAAYADAAAAAGVEPGVVRVPSSGGPSAVFVADDVDAAWQAVGPHLLHDALMYDSWMSDWRGSSSRSSARTVDELRAENGPYRVLSVDEATSWIASGNPLLLHPLCGGAPPELGWESLRLAALAHERAAVDTGAGTR